VEENEIKVQAYSGYKGNERPLCFSMEGKELVVDHILDRWYGEDYDYFKVLADDAEIYLLKRDRETDRWYGKKASGLRHKA
jgi:hypothetical protein